MPTYRANEGERKSFVSLAAVRPIRRRVVFVLLLVIDFPGLLRYRIPAEAESCSHSASRAHPSCVFEILKDLAATPCNTARGWVLQQQQHPPEERANTFLHQNEGSLAFGCIYVASCVALVLKFGGTPAADFPLRFHSLDCF